MIYAHVQGSAQIMGRVAWGGCRQVGWAYFSGVMFHPSVHGVVPVLLSQKRPQVVGES